jgi:2-(1,2-epoxy-1,2-dihydrophenyl)acetyl-CoA isomerase
MSYQTIIFGVEDGVATITLNRPEVMNGLNARMRAELLHALRNAPEACASSS